MINCKDLTVIIPTIGRNSLISAINSIDVDCHIYAILDKCYSDLYHELEIKLINNVKNHNVELIQSDKAGPGHVKQFGIDKVSSRYFIILDDDDTFVEGFLEYAINFMRNGADWVATHYSENPVYFTKDWLEVYPTKFASYYFNTDDYIHRLNYIYPGSEVMCLTDKFRSLNKDDFFRYKLNYLDDVIPMTNYMSKSFGILNLSDGIHYGLTNGTVSHTNTNPIDIPDFNRVVKEISRMLVSMDLSDMDRKLWKRVLTNLLDVSYFNYKFSQNPKQS